MTAQPPADQPDQGQPARPPMSDAELAAELRRLDRQVDAYLEGRRLAREQGTLPATSHTDRGTATDGREQEGA